MQELANSALLYPKTLEGLTSFFDHIELDRTLSENDDEPDSVTLITLHNTKGLEYPRVIITGIEEGVFPRKDKEGMDLEEERRQRFRQNKALQSNTFLIPCLKVSSVSPLSLYFTDIIDNCQNKYCSLTFNRLCCIMNTNKMFFYN